MDNDTTWISVTRAALLRRWLTIVIAAMLGIIAAVVAAMLIPRVYRVEVVLAPVADGLTEGGGLSSLLGGMGGLAALAGLPLSSGGQKNEAIAILRSKTFTQEFIRRRNLLPVLFDSQWDAGRNAWKPGADIPTLSDGYRLIDRQVRKVVENKATGLVTLTLDWRDRTHAAEWANSMIAQLNEEMRQRAIADAKRSLEFLDKQLKSEQVVGLQQAIYRLVESQMNRQMLAQVREQFAFRVVDAAIVPDEKDSIWPRRRILLPLGMAIGLILGVCWALVAERTFWRRN